MSCREVAGGAVRRAARVRFEGGELELWTEVPAAFVAAPDDASPFLAAALPISMRRREDLDVDGPVSRRLLEACEEIQAVYSAWHRGLEPVAVRAAEARVHEPAADTTASFISRGVDSMYSAAVERADPVGALVFGDGLEPLHDDSVRAGEIRLAREAADALSLPLVVARTNIRELTDPVVADWEDHVAPGLASLALSLSGGIRAAVIPSSDTYATFEPCGSSPLLDPLFSTEAVSIRHDSIVRSRLAKVEWLAEHRPELVPLLKVCFKVNDTGNCGRCGKCLLTMVGLELAGVLDRAELFPDTIDLEAVGAIRIRGRKPWLDWSEAARALERSGGHAELTGAVAAVLERAPDDFDARLEGGLIVPAVSLRDHHANTHLALLPARDAGAERIGLVRMLDRGRHFYRAGRVDAGLVVGELGALHRTPSGGSVPFWLTEDGIVETSSSPLPGAPRRSLVEAVHWTLAPLGWRGMRGRVRRLGAVPRRALLLRRRTARAHPTGPPAGYLHALPGDGHVPLWCGIHPVTGDQLLSNSRFESLDMGYGEPTLLGYLDGSAPVTGKLGCSRPELLWASRFGQRVRGG